MKGTLDLLDLTLVTGEAKGINMFRV